MDASVVVKRWIPDSDSVFARRLSESRLFAPELLAVEVANALCRGVSNGALSSSTAAGVVDELGSAPITWARDGDLAGEALAPALAHRRPVYDCVHVALAKRLDVPLVTADRRLVASFPSKGRASPARIVALASLG